MSLLIRETAGPRQSSGDAAALELVGMAAKSTGGMSGRHLPGLHRAVASGAWGRPVIRKAGNGPKLCRIPRDGRSAYEGPPCTEFPLFPVPRGILAAVRRRRHRPLRRDDPGSAPRAGRLQSCDHILQQRCAVGRRRHGHVVAPRGGLAQALRGRGRDELAVRHR
jgi:hypothetical protein